MKRNGYSTEEGETTLLSGPVIFILTLALWFITLKLTGLRHTAPLHLTGVIKNYTAVRVLVYPVLNSGNGSI